MCKYGFKDYGDMEFHIFSTHGLDLKEIYG